MVASTPTSPWRVMAIETYAGAELSLQRALRVAPESFIPAYRWFIAHEGELGPRPSGKYAPLDVAISLVSQRGIHKPKGTPYALTVTSVGNEVYGADQLNHLDDGTWIMQYCAHRRNMGETAGSPEYNRSLRRCLFRGLPVGVFKKEGRSYRNLGLAFVERYNSVSDMFWLHGPVTGESDLSPLSADQRHRLSQELREPVFDQIDLEMLLTANEEDNATERDERERVAATMVRRKNQSRFRKMLLEAYGGRCAISRYNTEPALQAAHISSYLGSKSQLVTNGLLLRADLHLLFDESLLAVNPDTLSVEISRELYSTPYSEYADRRIMLPQDKHNWPSESRIAAQYQDFLRSEQLAAAR